MYCMLGITILSSMDFFLLTSIILLFMQVHIAQRGAIQPLVDMLKSSDAQLREMSAFALGRLAQVIITNKEYVAV